MSKAIVVRSHGGPEVLQLEDVDPGKPAAGEVLLRHTAIGLNYIDVYFRTGLYPAELPLIPGAEAAGVVEALGEGVKGVQVGDRVSYTVTGGAYSQMRRIAADKLVTLPDGVSDEQAAAATLKGLTVEFLLRRTHAAKPGEVVLVHAAAGGVGQIFGQWARHIGVTTIGTVGSDDKVALAKACGYDHVVNYRSTDFVAAVREITGGKMCDVVYDSVGNDTYMGSLDCLKPRGLLVVFGQSSGPIPPFNLGILAQKGSLFVTRPTLFGYIAKRDEHEAAAEALFSMIEKGVVKVPINQRYALADVAKAHADLEARRTTGATVLTP